MVFTTTFNNLTNTKCTLFSKFQHSDMCEMCHPWSWPRQPITSESYHMTSFYEGSFLRMILDKLSRMLDQVQFF